VQPYDFAARLSSVCSVDDTVIPCSSGGANTVMMQSFLNKTGQYFFNNRALASMGYGLAGALGAAVARPERRTVLIEGDGGFAQNLQELGTVRVRQPNLKIFLFLNNGYASIRMTQVNYFGGQYLGCDTESGLGFPNWELLSKAFGVYCLELDDHFDSNPEFIKSWNDRSPTMYLVPIHAEQTYFPKISSRVAESGAMESAPLDEMSPDVESSIIEKIRQLTR
jgi:acetolactate synthase-1/2/3 large subunit